MVTLSDRTKRIIYLTLLVFVGMLAIAPMSLAAEGTEAEAAAQSHSVGTGLRAMGLALGAGIAIAGAGLGTGRAQSAVGAAGAGAITEKPELFGNILILFAIPETIVVFGFVIAILLWLNI